MRLLLKKKNLIILSSVLLGSCSAAAPSAPVVYCHSWDPEEKAAIRSEIEGLPDDSALHLVIRDYERVCITLR